jgi:membrane protease YdiL (CAAX protease family)
LKAHPVISVLREALEDGVTTSFVRFAFWVYCIWQNTAAAIASRQKATPAAPPKKTYLPGIARITSSTAIALIAALICHIDVLGSSRISRRTLLLGGAFLVLNLCLDPLEYRLTPNERRKAIVNFLPHTAGERVAWIFLSMAAGVGEEIIYRSVLFGVVFPLTNNYWIAAAVSAVLFALAHFSHGWIAIADLFVVAICLQWLVKISGGLYIAIGIHFVHNLFNGIVWGALLKPMSIGRTEAGLFEGQPNVAASSLPNMDSNET